MEKSMLDNDSPETGKVLKTIAKKELFTAPEGYFNGFPAELMAHIQSAPVLHSLEKKEFHTTPDGYFETFSADLMARIQSAPAFYSLEKKELVEQPSGYADQLEAKVLASVKPTKQARTVPMSTQLFRWTAVAATLALLFTVGYHQLTGSQQVITQEPSLAYSNMSDAYEQYLANETNIDDAIAFYVNEGPEVNNTDTPAELEYLMNEEIDFENF